MYCTPESTLEVVRDVYEVGTSYVEFLGRQALCPCPAPRSLVGGNGGGGGGLCVCVCVCVNSGK